ncbi:MAG: glucose-6-phosphate isomerase [Xanthomonadales bacterium]|nr:glucose-6-phosphate isomerase [Xanthomonadales bacterium]
MLQKHNNKLRQTHLSRWMDQAGRFARFSCGHDGLLLDYSRVRLDQAAVEQLLQVAQDRGVLVARDRLFAGEAVNTTEHRPAMHMALRDSALLANVPAEDAGRVRDTQTRMRAIAADLHKGELPGPERAGITDIVHVGIGGSLLGPRLVCEALPPGGAETPRVHFLGSVDAYPREQLLSGLSPESTVVILASKSFSTPDTLMHGQRLLHWLRQGLGDEAASQRLFAVTAAADRAVRFGVPAEHVLFLPEWVGGRYSLWSAVSLVAAAQSGPEAFDAMLSGAASMDRHFCAAEPAQNLPVMLGLLGIWHRNVCGLPAWGVIPYDQRLRLLPAHLQQLIMESNGKSMSLGGQPVACATSPLVFGEPGTEAQHSLFQALHQGTDIAPLHFVGVIRPAHGDPEAHEELLANMLAQATALATGRSAEETRGKFDGGSADDEALLAHRSFEGNRPSELLLVDELDPHHLGALLALYEHKVFVESVIWDINAFDQWGVELGKTLAPGIRKTLAGEGEATASLAELVDYIRERS